MNSAAYRKGNTSSYGGTGIGNIAASFKSSDAEQTPIMNAKNGSMGNNSTTTQAVAVLSASNRGT